ncbi:MAG: hemerythrin domain-containing protein [Bdellovibrionota bacterium]
MQIFDVLVDEHSQLERLAHRLEATPPEAAVMRRELLGSLQTSWVTHARAEEKAFYDPMRAWGGSFDEVVLEGYAEHCSIEAIMRELEIVNPSNSRFDAKARSLHYAMVKHFEEEESWIFEAARRHLGESRATELAETYFEFKSRLSRGDSPHHLSVGVVPSSSAESNKSSSSA